MTFPEFLLAVLLTVFLPLTTLVVVTRYRYRMKQLAMAGENPKLLAAHEAEIAGLKQEREQLEARVQNLESIVCSVDLELNTRLNRLLQQSPSPPSPPSLPASGEGAAGSEPRGDAARAASSASSRGSVLAMALQPGQRIAERYTIERELGHGGMGAVYLAADQQLGELVALKLVNTALTGDPAAAAERFRREVAAARKITHANVIRIHDLIEDGPLLMLSMEYVAGMTLGAYLGRVGLMRVDEAQHFVGQICDGLGAAHQAGVVHRDLKPSNVLLSADKRIRLIDFGLAKASFMSGMTATGLIMGTPEYMAPEQVKGLACDARTDLYSLGALAYHLLVGRPPFAGETPIAVGFAHVTEPARPPRQLRAELPEGLERALLKALEKDPNQRFSDAAEMKQALFT